jgi:hypothetical protein
MERAYDCYTAGDSSNKIASKVKVIRTYAKKLHRVKSQQKVSKKGNNGGKLTHIVQNENIKNKNIMI